MSLVLARVGEADTMAGPLPDAPGGADSAAPEGEETVAAHGQGSTSSLSAFEQRFGARLHRLADGTLLGTFSDEGAARDEKKVPKSVLAASLHIPHRGKRTRNENQRSTAAVSAHFPISRRRLRRFLRAIISFIFTTPSLDEIQDY